jgi:RNA methyltransferase, TrmH family
LSASTPTVVRSRDNPLLVRVRRLSKDPSAYRRLGQVWLEGDHLCRALRSRGGQAVCCVISESAWQRAELRELAGWAAAVSVVTDILFDGLSGLESAGKLGFVLEQPGAVQITPDLDSVVLDRLQDAGNVGSILRTAAAFGVTQVVALHGTAALWSPKVLRAGMGAHFGLRLVEGAHIDDLSALRVPWIGTALSTDQQLNRLALPSPCAWIFGHEGQGLNADLLARCTQVVRIPQPGGEESLNVAAAAAVCLYESLRQRT